MKIYQKIWILLKPFWFSRHCIFSALLFISILAMIYLLVEIQVWLNNWNSDFFNALEKIDANKLKNLVLWFIGVLAILIIVQVNKSWLIKLLNIRWRKWLTEYYLNLWLKDNQYYYYLLEHKDQQIDNPDQRIAEDIRMFIDRFLALTLGFIQSFSMLVTFIIVLWNVSGTLEFELFNQQWKVKGSLVYCVFIFVLINSFIAHFIGKKIRYLNREKQKSEANFRTALINQQTNAETLVLDEENHNKQKNELNQLFYSIKENWHRLMNCQRNLEYWQVLHQRISAVIPLFLLIPIFIAGKINIGGLMKARQAFMLVSNNLSWFIFKYDDLAEFAAIVDRLYQFHVAIAKKHHNPTQIGEQIIIKNGEILLPNKFNLLNNINLSLKNGCWLYIQGRSGIGKTTLLKTIMGVWPYAKGLFIKPEKIYMVTQNSYIPTGTLADVLRFPSQGNINDNILISTLIKVNLAHLIPDLNHHHQWQKILSSGEKQRIGIARVLLKNPEWLLLDEATSHLDEESALTLLTLLKQSYPQMSVLVVSHQNQIAQQVADSIYQLEADQ